MTFRIVLTLLLNVSLSYGQTTINKYLPDFAALSPNAAGLGKYGDVPVSLYTGTPQIDIPIYRITEGELSLNIALKYHASGIQVDQRSTWVGLGWVLDGGGVIIRKVRGIYDERKNRGFLFVNNYVNDNVWDNVSSDFSEPSVVVSENIKYLSSGMDTAPDEFVFNFSAGRTGKFYFDKKGVPLSTDNLKIEYYQRDKPHNLAVNEIYKFKITAEDGTQYLFEEVESTRNIQENTYEINTAWYLTKVISADDKSTINLTYNRFNYSNNDYIPGEFLFDNSTTNVSSCSPTNEWSSYSSAGQQVQIDNIYISHITSSNVDVSFDIIDNQYFVNKKLNVIKVNRKNAQEIKRFTFSYKDYSTTRILLDQIQESSNTDQIPPYKFIYDETPIPVISNVVLGSQRSYGGLDYWGYYNGPTTVYDSRIQKEILGYPEPQTIYGLPNRNPVFQYAKSGVLTKILYPTTGGYTQFDYELNDYSYVSNRETKFNIVNGGGLRIKTITNYDGLSHSNDIVKTYTYKSQDTQLNSSGVIANDPQTTFEYSSPMTSRHKPFSTKIWFPSSILPIDIGYSQVIETVGDGSFKVYRYNTERDYPNTPFNNDIPIVFYDGFPKYVSFFRKLSHPFNPSEGKYYYMKGTLKETMIYDAQGSIRDHSYYNYVPRETGSIKSFAISNGYGPNLICFDMPLAIYFEQSYSQAIGHPELIEEKRIRYQNDRPTLTENKYYEYNPNHWQLSKVTINQSDGTQKVNILRYPLDFGNISTSATGQSMAIKNLQDRNIINQVIEEYSYIQNDNQTNQRVITGSLKTYDPSAPYLKEIYNLELPSSILLNNFSASNIQNGLFFTMDANYKLKASFDLYDDVGNLRQYSLSDNIKNCYVWAYNKRHPIADVKNATSDNVRITSFEEDYPYTAEMTFIGSFSSIEKKTGNQSLVLNSSGSIQISGLTQSSKDHKLSFWTKFNGGVNPVVTITNGDQQTSYWVGNNTEWTYFEIIVKPSSNITISGQGSGADVFVDELRLYPMDAQVTTYTFDPVFGVTSESDNNGIGKKYEYDDLGRLIFIRDNNENILKNYKYSYKK